MCLAPGSEWARSSSTPSNAASPSLAALGLHISFQPAPGSAGLPGAPGRAGPVAGGAVSGGAVDGGTVAGGALDSTAAGSAPGSPAIAGTGTPALVPVR